MMKSLKAIFSGKGSLVIVLATIKRWHRWGGAAR
jgi:hypothetical protein